MNTLINQLKLALIILTLSGGVVLVASTAQAQPFTEGNVPDYCSATPLTVTTTQVASKIDQYGKMDPEFKTKIIQMRDGLNKAGCVGYCKWHTMNVFSLLEDDRLLFDISPNQALIDEFKLRTVRYKFLRDTFGSNVYIKADLPFPQLIQELEKLPRNDHVYTSYHNYRDYLEVEAGRQKFYPGHDFNIVKDSADTLRVITTTAKLSEMLSVFETMPLNKDFFKTPETLSKLFIEGQTPSEVAEHYRFDIIGINREGTEGQTIDPDVKGGAGP